MAKGSENSAEFSVLFEECSSKLDLRQLAPALLGWAELCDELNALENGSHAKVAMHFGFSPSDPGAIPLRLLQTEKAQLSIESGTIASAEVLIARAAKLYELLSWLGGKKPDKVKTKGEEVAISLAGETRNYPLPVARAAESSSVREAAEKAVRPLKNGLAGTASLAFGERKSALTTSALASEIFLPLEESEENAITTFTREVALTVVAPNFREGNKWRFTDGSGDVWATITDAEFLKEIEAHRVTFGKNDVLLCCLNVTQWQTRSGLKSDAIITKVTKRVPAMKQLTLLGAD